MLVVNVIGKRVLYTTSDSAATALISGHKTFMYYVNDGVYCSFNNVISYNLVHVPTPLQISTKGSSKYHSTIIWGQTCDSIDRICETNMPELNIGDWLYFDNMGAYTVAVSSTFNGFGIPVKFHYVTESYR